MAKDDYYSLLNVNRDADNKQLKSAYRKLAMQYHPDRNPGDDAAEAMFKKVSEAYEVLSDEQKRAAYDRYGHDAFQQQQSRGGGGGGGQPFGNINDIFEEMFGGGFGGGGRKQQARGKDKRYNLSITLEEAYKGHKVTVRINRKVACNPCDGSGAAAGSKATTCSTCGGNGRVRMQQGFFAVEQTCPHCHGKGTMIDKPCGTCHGSGLGDEQKNVSITVPAGIDDGMRMRVNGEGDAGEHNAPPGDLYVFVSVKPHKIFERDELNLHCAVPISMVDAALGSDIDVPLIDGSSAKVRIAAGTQTAHKLRLKSKGMPDVNHRNRLGDMYVHVQVETPCKLTERQQELLHEFKEEEVKSGNNQNPERSSFFDKVKEFFKQHHA